MDNEMTDDITNYVTEVPEGEPCTPPDGIAIIRPFHELTIFDPCEALDENDWVERFEMRYTRPLALGVARVFDVNLIDDATYIEMPEEAKSSYLSCVLTRAGIAQIRPGIFEWTPIVVVARYMIVVAIRVQIDAANNSIAIPMLLLWNNAAQEYAPVVDEKAGKIENPAVILQILNRYAHMEKLVK
jgi:hypothetical protein